MFWFHYTLQVQFKIGNTKSWAKQAKKFTVGVYILATLKTLTLKTKNVYLEELSSTFADALSKAKLKYDFFAFLSR